MLPCIFNASSIRSIPSGSKRKERKKIFVTIGDLKHTDQVFHNLRALRSGKRQFYVVQKRRGANFGISKLWKGRLEKQLLQITTVFPNVIGRAIEYNWKKNLEIPSGYTEVNIVQRKKKMTRKIFYAGLTFIWSDNVSIPPPLLARKLKRKRKRLKQKKKEN